MATTARPFRSARPAPAVRRLAVTAVAGLAAVGLLGGCGFETRQQAAAVVNGTVIHESDVQETAGQLKAAKFDTSESIVVTGLIAAPLLSDAMAASGGFQPDSTYASTIASIPDASESTKQFIFAAVMLQQDKLPAAIATKYEAAVNSAKISLNPKFGQFTKTAAPVFFSLGAASPSWIVPTTPATTAPAGQ